MSALSFRRLVLLALVFVTAARAAGPTPTSVEDSGMNIHARDGGSPYGVRSGSNHDRNGGYPNTKDDRDRSWSNGGWNYAHNYGYNGGGDNHGGSDNHGGWGDKGWGNGGDGKGDNHGDKGNDGWGNGGGSNHGGDKNHEDWQNGGGGNGGGGNDWGNGGGWGGNDGGSGGNGGGSGGSEGGWGGNGGGGNGGGHGEGGSGWGDGGNHGGGGGGDYWPQPSQRPKQRLATKPTESMSPSELADSICPSDLSACPIAEPGTLSALPTSVSGWADRGFECVDLRADLRACGGCPSLDSKYDCTTIEGAEQIACVTGQCVVDSCRAGYQLDSNKNACHRQ